LCKEYIRGRARKIKTAEGRAARALGSKNKAKELRISHATMLSDVGRGRLGEDAVVRVFWKGTCWLAFVKRGSAMTTPFLYIRVGMESKLNMKEE
jgi:hypothetical protein